jgi:hypothetical protein
LGRGSPFHSLGPTRAPADVPLTLPSSMKHQNLRAVTASLLLFASQISSAASVSIDPGPTPIEVRLTGTIEAGDAQSLLTHLRRAPSLPWRLVLDSPGGSLLESLKIAELVERTRLETHVSADRICASACFFIFLSGAARFATGSEAMLDSGYRRALLDSSGRFTFPGFVGIHRPYEVQMTSPSMSQIRIMRSVTAHLESKLLSRRLTDLMMSRPSNDVYWLTDTDLEEISRHPPHIEEFLIHRCKYDRNSWSRETAQFQAGNRERAAQIQAERMKSEQCQATELLRLQSEGHGLIRGGWEPKLR